MVEKPARSEYNDLPEGICAYSEVKLHGKAWQLILRRQILNARSDLIRHNIYWRSFEGLRFLVAAVRRKPDVDPDAPLADSFVNRGPVTKLNSYLSLQ